MVNNNKSKIKQNTEDKAQDINRTFDGPSEPEKKDLDKRMFYHRLPGLFLIVVGLIIFFSYFVLIRVIVFTGSGIEIALLLASLFLVIFLLVDVIDSIKKRRNDKLEDRLINLSEDEKRPSSGQMIEFRS